MDWRGGECVQVNGAKILKSWDALVDHHSLFFTFFVFFSLFVNDGGNQAQPLNNRSIMMVILC